MSKLKMLEKLSFLYNKVAFAVVGSTFYVIMMGYDIYKTTISETSGVEMACVLLTIINGFVLVGALLSMFTGLIGPKLREIIFFTLLSVGIGELAGAMYSVQETPLPGFSPVISGMSLIAVLLLGTGICKEE